MTTTTNEPTGERELDQARVEAFAGRMVSILNDAFVAIMTSIGHQTGLFETLVQLPPATSVQVAERAGLDERYVREWLNAMTTARFLDYDPAARTYLLPPEHAASLTKAAGPDNLGRAMSFVSLLAEVEQPVIECFRRGGGLSYADYPRFHRLMAEDSAAVFDAALVDGILPLVPRLPDRLRKGIRVADIGCGSGHAVNVMARAFPASTFIGYDFSAEGIQAGRAEAASLGLPNARFEVLDVAELDQVAAFELVTAFDAIHDQAQPGDVLSRVARSVTPDGSFLMVDIKASSNVEDNIDLPWGTFLYGVSTLHCMTVSLGLDGVGLGTAWGEQLAVSMLHEAGFADVDIRTVDEDPFNSYYVATKH